MIKKFGIAIALATTLLGTGCSNMGAITQMATGGGSGASAGDLVKETQIALSGFVGAQINLAKAMNVYDASAATQKQVENLKNGDPTSSETANSIKTTAVLSAELQAKIEEGIKKGAVLDAGQKALAGQATLQYVQGLASSTKVAGKVSQIVKNPTSVSPAYLPQLTAIASNVPGVVQSAAGSTSSLFSYLTKNGVDVSKAKQAADSMDK